MVHKVNPHTKFEALADPEIFHGMENFIMDRMTLTTPASVFISRLGLLWLIYYTLNLKSLVAPATKV